MAIIGGGPGGYEAATVAARMGAQVTLIEARGLGGSAVLTDVVPSKTLIATAEQAQETAEASDLGITTRGVSIDMARVNERVRELATSQSADIHASLRALGVQVIAGRASLKPGLDDRGRRRITVALVDTQSFDVELAADIVLLATGARPRELPSAKPDGQRILTWAQLYGLDELPGHLVVVGSGVTGAEFAGAYRGLGAKVTLVSSRDRILPGEDTDAAEIIERVFVERGMQIERRSRAEAVVASGEGVEVTLSDGRVIHGSHCLMAVGAVANTEGLGLAESGVETTDSGHIRVDRVSRTTSYRVYAAGDCTGVLPLASVAAQQGRIAMWHALGDAVTPLDLSTVSANVFTAPEIATVGVGQDEVDVGLVRARAVVMPLGSNPRAKMQGIHDGFVKVFCLPTTGIVIGGVIVAPRASELVHVLSVAVSAKITVDELAQAFTVYPSVSGSIAEAARRLHGSAGQANVVY